jgi:hypothetical protein
MTSCPTTPASRAYASQRENAETMLERVRFQLGAHAAAAHGRHDHAFAGDVAAAVHYLALALARLGDTDAAADLGLAGIPRRPEVRQ